MPTVYNIWVQQPWTNSNACKQHLLDIVSHDPMGFFRGMSASRLVRSKYPSNGNAHPGIQKKVCAGSLHAPTVVLLFTVQEPLLVYPKALNPGVVPKTPVQRGKKFTKATRKPEMLEWRVFKPVKYFCRNASAVGRSALPCPDISSTRKFRALVGA